MQQPFSHCGQGYSIGMGGSDCSLAFVFLANGSRVNIN